MPFSGTVHQKIILHQVVVVVELQREFSWHNDKLNPMPNASFNGGKGYAIATRPFRI